MTTKIKEEYLCDDLSEQINYSDKCGEVFVTKMGIFSCFCILCKHTFEHIEIFTEHILTLHLGHIKSKNENITHENNDMPVSLDMSTNFLEIEMNLDDHTDGTIASEITFNKNVTADPLDVHRLQTDQNEDKNPPEPEVDNKLEFEINEFTGINNNNCKSPVCIKDSYFNEGKHLDLRPYKCDICNSTYKLKRAFLLHKKHHETLMPNCQHCGKYFRKISTFKTHNQILCAQRIKLGHKLKLELPDIKCKYCEKIFKKADALKKHEKLHEDSPFKCNICQKMFMEKHLMEDHIRTHTGEKPFKCEYCSVSLTNSRNLKQHILIHTGKKEKTIFCSFGCGRSFYRQRECSGHERTHTGEKPYICELCGRYFTYECQLNFHKKIFHTDKKNWSHKCDQCNKVFVTLKQLRNHTVVHTGEKPYECDQCSGRFSKASGLREHKKLHSGIKKHVCTICNKAFAQTAGLYSHMKSHGIIKKSTEIN